MYRLVLIASMMAAVIPAFVYLFFVRWLERFSREPLRVLLLVMAWGAIGGTVCGVVFARWMEGAALLWQPGQLSSFAEYAVYVPLAEEVAKGLVLIWLASSPRLRTRANGLVYGMAVGLGFAITENLVYSIHVYKTGGFDSWYINVVIRMLFASTVHAIASSLFGLAMAWGRMRLAGKPRYVLGVLVALGISVAVHGSWNAIHFVGGATGDQALPTLAFLVTPLLVFLLLGITWWVLRLERRPRA